MITPSSSNDNLNEFDARVFIMIGQSLSEESDNEESTAIIQSLNKSLGCMIKIQLKNMYLYKDSNPKIKKF